MNTYLKFAPNVFLAKCPEEHQKGDVIEVETQYGNIHKCIIWNLFGKTKEGFFFYSITREDGFNSQKRAENRAERYKNASIRAFNTSEAYFKKTEVHKDFLSLGEPIKIGHHSEKRHRRLIERNNEAFKKGFEFSKKAESYESKIAYWEAKAEEINLSMPESLEFYQYKLEQATEYHRKLKAREIPRPHGLSMQYAKNDVNELTKKVALAKRLWG